MWKTLVNLINFLVMILHVLWDICFLSSRTGDDDDELFLQNDCTMENLKPYLQLEPLLSLHTFNMPKAGFKPLQNLS